MTTKNNELFWRLFLLLHKGCPLISRQLISKEIAKSGYDLDRHLFDNKKQLLEGKFGLGNADIDILFPENKKTDIEHWDAHLFPCVILTLFSKSIHTNERQHMRSILHLYKDIEGSLPEASLDPETYDEYKETLCEALRSLAHALSEQVENEITDLIDVLTTESLNLQAITGTILPAEIKEKLLHFLEIFSTYSETIHPEGLPPQMVATTNERNTNLTVLNEIKTNVIYERIHAEQPLADVLEAQAYTQDLKETLLELRKKDNIEFGIEGTFRDGENDTAALETKNKEKATEVECLGSEEYMTEMDKGSEEIVANALQPLTEEEIKSTELVWKDKEFEQSMKEKSLAKVIDHKLALWEQEYVHVAVLGRTGVGKSRFINAIRCISKDDSGFAPVGSVETTLERKAYPHPMNKRLILWDLPGLGTEKFPREDYVKSEAISFKDYHIYFIMSSDRFTQDETFLADEIEKIGKIFLFVRTRVDLALEEIPDVKGEIKKIRDNCVSSLSKGKYKLNEVYLISSKYTNHQYLDFGKLLERLVMSLTGLKKDVLLFSLQFNTMSFIESKATALRSRIYKISIKSAGGGAIPIPGFSLVLDYMLISKELNFYRTSLGITEDDLKRLAEKTKKSVKYLKINYKLKTFDSFKLTTKHVPKIGGTYCNILQHIATSEAIESTSKLFPVFGSVVAAGISCATTYHFLKSNLDMMVEDAKKMMSILLEETGSTVLHLNQNYSS